MVSAAASLPLAHVGHWLWVFYLVPVLIVIAGIFRSVWIQRHTDRDDPRRRMNGDH